MRKFSLLLSTIVVLALALTACGGQQTSTSVPSTNVPPVTVESTATEAPSATEAPATTSTASVPVTGAENPSRVSKMLDFQVFNQNGDQVGQVNDLVLDLDNARIAYVVVNTTGDAGTKTVLIPWESLQVQSQAGATGGQQNAFVLLADPEFLKNAPDTDLSSVLPQMCQTAGNWDADIRSFWQSGAVPGTPSANSTASAGTATTTSGTGTGTGTPSALATATTGSGTGTGTGTATPTASTGNGRGNAVGQGAQLQGVVLASKVIGATISVGAGIGNAQGAGNGTSTSTETPSAMATATAGSGAGTGTGTATPTTSAGAGTGTGNSTGNTGLGNIQATIADLIVDPATGDVRYAVIKTSFDNAEHWIPIPVGMLRCDMANNAFMTTANANVLQSAPFFTEDQFPDTSMTGWDQQWSDFWSSNAGNGTGSGTGTGMGTGGTATATP